MEGAAATPGRLVTTPAERIGESVVYGANVEDPAAPTPAEQLRALFWKLKENRIRMNGPSMSSRASSLGNECEAALFFERTVPAEMRDRHKAGTQAIFDLGNCMERYVVRELEDMGCEVVQRGRDYLDRGRELSGHTDLKVRRPGWPRAITSEVKGLNPFSAGAIETLDDIRHNRAAWIRKYYSQLQTYLGLEALDEMGRLDEELLEPGLFILLNKSTGAIAFIDCPPDVETIRALLAKAERIRDAVKANAIPKRRPSDECERCAFLTVCAPARNMGPGVTMLDSPELAALLARRAELAEAHRDYEGVDREAKALLPSAVGEYLAGEYLVQITERSRKASAAYSYLNRDIKKVGGA